MAKTGQKVQMGSRFAILLIFAIFSDVLKTFENFSNFVILFASQKFLSFCPPSIVRMILLIAFPVRKYI